MDFPGTQRFENRFFWELNIKKQTFQSINGTAFKFLGDQDRKSFPFVWIKTGNLNTPEYLGLEQAL